MPSVSDGGDLLIVLLNSRQIDGRLLLEVLIAFNVLGVSESLAIALIGLVDAGDNILKIGDVFLRGFDTPEEAFRRDPVLPKGVT